MRLVRHLLEDKPAGVVAIAPDEPVIEAIRRMAQHGIGSLLVMQDTALTGILSERDYARRIVLEGRSSRDTPVRDIMTADVLTVSPDDSCAQCMQLMTEHRVRHLPVMEGDEVVGVVSIGDLVKAVMADQQHQLDQLHRYIQS